MINWENCVWCSSKNQGNTLICKWNKVVFGAMQLTLSIYLKQNVLLLKCCRDSCYNLVVTEQTLSSYRKPHKIVIPDICWGDLYLRFFFHRIKKNQTWHGVESHTELFDSCVYNHASWPLVIMSSIAKKFQQLSFILNRFTGLVTELNKRYFWVVSVKTIKN